MLYLLLAGFILGAAVVAGAVCLGAYMAWRLMEREAPLPAAGKPKPFECFALSDEEEAMLEEQK